VSSSGSERDRPCGMIMQGNRVVGAICIPEGTNEEFIEQFNSCYGPLRMQCAQTDRLAEVIRPNINPDRFRLPAWFRHVWQAAATTGPVFPETHKRS